MNRYQEIVARGVGSRPDPESLAMAERVARAIMIFFGGMPLSAIQVSLANFGCLFREEHFNDEFDEMVAAGLLQRRRTLVFDEPVYRGNVPRDPHSREPKLISWLPRPSIERRPDKALIQLARQGKFQSIIIDE